MNNLWRKSFMAGILSVSLTAGAVTPAFASAAPDGKTDAASLAGGMGISRNWESWKAEWEAVKNDWTQVSLTPGSDFSQLNFAWYSKKDNSDTAEKKEEQVAQEFSAQSGDAFSELRRKYGKNHVYSFYCGEYSVLYCGDHSGIPIQR